MILSEDASDHAISHHIAYLYTAVSQEERLAVVRHRI